MAYDWAYRGFQLTITTNNQSDVVKHFSIHYHSTFLTLLGVLSHLVRSPKHVEQDLKIYKAIPHNKYIYHSIRFFPSFQLAESPPRDLQVTAYK